MDRTVAISEQKFIAKVKTNETFGSGSTVKIGDIFKANDELDKNNQIISSNVKVTVSPVGQGSTVIGLYTADTTDWTNGTLQFTGQGAAKITITDYNYCTPTTLDITVELTEKFDLMFPNTEKYIYRVGNNNAVSLASLFKAKEGYVIENVSINFDTTELVNLPVGNVTAEFTKNETEWSKGTIKFTGTGFINVKIESNSNPTILTVEVVDAVNATSATSAKSNNVVLLNDVNFTTIEVSNGYTLYGNGFKMEATKDVMHDTIGVGFVTLNNGTLDNVQIICPNFSYAIIYKNQITSSENTAKPSDSNNDARGNVRSAVMADGNSKIINSYVHGGRAAIYLRSGNLLVDNSTISGGAAANIHALSAQSLMLRDTTLIQKPFKDNVHNTDKTIMGFSGLFECDKNGNATPLILEGTFIQDAWINESHKQYVPKISAGLLSYDTAKIIEEALSKEEYVHYLNGVKSLNLGFTYVNSDITEGVPDELPEEAVNDNRENKDNVPYDSVKVSFALVYSYKNDKGTLEKFVTEEYSPSRQGTTTPTLTFTDATDDRVFKTLFDSSDNRWESSLTVNLDNGNYTFSFDKLLAKKYGKSLGYTVKTVDGKAVDTSKAISLTSSGVTEYVLTVKDEKVTHTIYFILTATKSEIPGPEKIAEPGGTPLLVVKSKNSDWSCAIPALEGTQIKYYTANGDVVLDLASLTPSATGKQNGTNNFWTTTKDGYTLKVTCGYIHEGKQVYGMPVVVNNGGNKMYFTISSTNGYVSTGTSARSVTLTYEFTDPNGKTLTFKKTWQFNYADYRSGKQYSYSDFVNGNLKEASSGGCVTADTLVTLADGSQVRIDEVKNTDQILVWDFVNGKYTTVSSSIIKNHGYDYYNVVTLRFADGTVVNTINGHGFFDKDLNKFVIIDESNVEEFIGHKFIKDAANMTTTQLVSYEVNTEYTESWSILTSTYYNCILEGMLTVTNAEVEGCPKYLMPYELTLDMKYDAEKIASDIEEYGLYSYEDFAPYVSEEVFEALGLAHFKVSVGKGYITWEEIIYLLELHFGDK